jgi:hypothetical protein
VHRCAAAGEVRHRGLSLPGPFGQPCPGMARRPTGTPVTPPPLLSATSVRL